jgi:histidinol-phosphate aminotransferase
MEKTKKDSSDFYFRRLLRPQTFSLEGYSTEQALDVSGLARISANENSLGTPPAVLDALRNLLSEDAELNRYPEITCGTLRNALAEKYDLPPEYFIVGNGLDDIINMLALTFLGPYDDVIIPAATFGVYAGATRMMGANAVVVSMKNDLSINLDAISDAVTSSTKMIFICSPNNPTGTVISASEFDDFLEELSLLPTRPLIIVDHAYIDFVRPGSGCLNAVTYARHYNNIAVMMTFSKISGLAGLRVGYLIAHPTMLSYIYRVRPPFTVNSLAQAAALVDITDKSVEAFKDKTRESVWEVKAELEKFLKDSGVSYVPSHANFIFAFYDQPYERLREVFKELLSRGVLTRLLKHDYAPSGLRFSIGSEEENRKLMDALAEII